MIYGDTPKSDVLENKDVEDVATSQDPQNPGVPPQPQLAQANQSLVAQSGAPEYAPHVINTPLAFLIKSALNTNIFGEPGWMGTGWRAGRDLQRHDIGGKTGTTNSSKDAWFSGYGPGVVTSVWIGFDDHRRDLGRTTASGAIKDQISGYEGGAKSAQPAWDDFMKTCCKAYRKNRLRRRRVLLRSTLTAVPVSWPAAVTAALSTLLRALSLPSRRFMKSAPPLPMAGETHELF